MKKFLLSLGLGLSIISGTSAASPVIDQLNAEIATVLAPIQNDKTVAKFSFNDIEINEERILNASVKSLFRKIGTYNIFELKIDNLSYTYGDGTKPTTVLKGSLGLDLTKAIPQEELNTLIPHASEVIENLAQEYTDEYGDSVTVHGVVTSTEKDAQDNYTALSAIVSFHLDLTKLPEEMWHEVMATSIALSLHINLKTGIEVEAFIISNPQYEGFEGEREGLKEKLEKLLAHDEDELEDIKLLITYLDNAAYDIVESHFLKLLKTLRKPI